MPRLLLAASTILLSWLAMQWVHELGHVLAAWLTGGTMVFVDLHPLRISQTVVRPNPHPLFVIWSGPVVGAILPLLLWLVSRRAKPGCEPLFRFFAGFCLIANGAYLGSGVIAPVGDAFDLLQHGTPGWQLAAFAAVMVPSGLWIWNGLGGHFGFGRNATAVTPKLAWSAFGGVILVALTGWLWSEWFQTPPR